MKALRFSSTVPSTAAGSLTPQCAVIGCPGQTGQGSAGRLIAYREHEVHERRAGPGKFVPVLAAQARRGQAIFFEKLKRQRIDRPSGMAPGAERFEFILSESIENCLGHNAARRITGTQKQDVERLARHKVSFNRSKRRPLWAPKQL